VTVETRTTCPYCGVGCGVIVTAREGRIVDVRGDPEHPANFGRLCTKGSTLHRTTVSLHGRALYPELRLRRDAARERVSWEAALDHAAERFAETIARHGPDSVAFYLSGQLLTEDYHVFNKLAKGLIGTNNVDTNSRLCMSSAVAGYKATLGADAPPACYEDFEHADLVVIAGSNMAWAHPVLFRRLEAARERRPHQRWVVIDPRRTETAEAADLHLPILPGTDVALFGALLHQLMWEEAIDRAFIAAHTEGFAELRASVRETTPAWAARLCGVPEAKILELAALWKAAPAVLSLYCQGLNQSSAGSDKNIALINLHLATAQIGRPGAGPFSLTGQPNAMGGREVGGLASLLPGHREVTDPVHRAEIERIWGVPPGRLSATPGKPAVALFDALRRREIRAVWIVCTNPAQSLPDARAVAEALGCAEFVVVQEAFTDTETARYADLLLPAASWGEKEGTVTNSERRISRVRAAVPPPGEARPDWAIAADFGRRLAARLGREADLMAFPGPEAAFLEHRAATVGRDLDIGGLDYARLEARGPTQWPCPEGQSEGQARLYTDGRFATPSGRARFVPTPWRPVAEPVSVAYPLALTTGRLRDQWHGMSRTGRVPELFGHTPEPRLHLHPEDALRRGLTEDALALVRSRRGSLRLRVRLDPGLRPGQCDLPMHWGAQSLIGPDAHGINTLTLPTVDPRSFQPELKHAAVHVSAAPAAWEVFALALVEGATDREDEEALALAERLRTLARGARSSGSEAFHATVTLLAGPAPGVLLRAADDHPWPAASLGALEAMLGLAGAEVLAYDDAPRASRRRIRLAAGRIAALCLSGPPATVVSGRWLRDLALAGGDAAALGLRLLAASAEAPAGVVSRGAVLCNCFGLTESEAIARLAAADGDPAARVAALQHATRSGTNCGSCLPALRSLARRATSAARDPSQGIAA
jgi:assimilatory nitrate reductase catalytic subunit